MRASRAVLLVGSIVYSLVAASTTPFTKPADVLTGLAIVAVAVMVCVRWPLRTRSLPDTRAQSARSRSPSQHGHPFLPWVLLVVVFTAWELFNYMVHGTRANHPTFSSITDAIDRFYLLKTLLFLGWLAGAWVIVNRGSRSPLLPRAPTSPGPAPAPPPPAPPVPPPTAPPVPPQAPPAPPSAARAVPPQAPPAPPSAARAVAPPPTAPPVPGTAP